MRDFIERLRAHPEHIRHRIAIGSAVGLTALVAVVWVTAIATSGTLALNLSSPTNDGTQTSPTVQGAVTQTRTGFDQLLGAIGALGASSTPPSLTIVNTASTTGADADADDGYYNTYDTDQSSAADQTGIGANTVPAQPTAQPANQDNTSQTQLSF